MHGAHVAHNREFCPASNIFSVPDAAGDHLYRMDYAPFVQKHRESGADITVAALPMDAARAEAFGVMKVSRPCCGPRFSAPAPAPSRLD